MENSMDEILTTSVNWDNSPKTTNYQNLPKIKEID